MMDWPGARMERGHGRAGCDTPLEHVASCLLGSWKWIRFPSEGILSCDELVGSTDVAKGYTHRRQRTPVHDTGIRTTRSCHPTFPSCTTPKDASYIRGVRRLLDFLR